MPSASQSLAMAAAGWMLLPAFAWGTQPIPAWVFLAAAIGHGELANDVLISQEKI